MRHPSPRTDGRAIGVTCTAGRPPEHMTKLWLEILKNSNPFILKSSTHRSYPKINGGDGIIQLAQHRGITFNNQLIEEPRVILTFFHRQVLFFFCLFQLCCFFFPAVEHIVLELYD